MRFDRALFENHLAFLSTHRGRVLRRAGRVTIDSHLPGFSYAVLERAQEVEPDVAAVHLLPGVDPPDGFERVGAIVYMTRCTEGAAWPVPHGLTMRRVSDDAGMDAFSTVQSHSFVPDAAERVKWHAWLREANRRNRHRAEQAFLLASDGDADVGVTLLLEHEGRAGIYAVATLPEQRGRGIATALLSEAAQRARARGVTTLTLQVAQGSAAERLYRRLGFAAVFEARIFKRV